MQPTRRIISANGLEATHVGPSSSPWLFVGLGSLVHRGLGAWGEAPETMVEYGGEFVSIDWPYDGFDTDDMIAIKDYILSIASARHVIFVTLSFGDVVARRLFALGLGEQSSALDFRVINIMGVTDYDRIHPLIRAGLALLVRLPDSARLFSVLARIAYALRIGVNPFHQDLTSEEIHHHRDAVRSGVTIGIKYRTEYMRQHGAASVEIGGSLKRCDILWSPLDLVFGDAKSNALRSGELWRVDLRDLSLHELSDGAHAAIVERGEVFEEAFAHILESYGLFKKKTLPDGVWSGV